MKTSQDKDIYIALISIHGLIRGSKLELGRDSDTGGQTKYVVDLAKSLGRREGLERVDLITRRVIDPQVSEDYKNPIERLTDKVQIVRVDAGPKEYVPKESLWDYLDIFTDNLIEFFNNQDRFPDVIHTHYADAGYVGVRLANLLGVPLVHTGHSLGRDKRKRLLAIGLSKHEIEETYNISRRIDAEEEALANASLIVASTYDEIEKQYALYNYYNPDRMKVVPPGTDLRRFYPPKETENFHFRNKVKCFLQHPEKPLILALSRPDERKNILTLVEVFGESEELREKANLLIVAGNRDDITEMDSGPQTVLTDILLHIDHYDLYGKVAFPKHHTPDDVPKIYRMVAESGGVFINPALTEPFGITLLEAAASGLPIVATENGGPVDIIANCQNGILVDPLDRSAIAEALLEFFNDKDAWMKASSNGIQGVAKNYSWDSHTEIYLDRVRKLFTSGKKLPIERPAPRVLRYRERAIITDLDRSLLGDLEAVQRFAEVIKSNRKEISFGIATGRRIDLALKLIRKYRIPMPDLLITSLGTRIHYSQELFEDRYWANHIDRLWNRQRVRTLLSGLPGLKLQPKVVQTPLKLSYYYDPEIGPSVDEIIALIRQDELTANVIFSFGQYLDILPSRASKGQALRYAAQRLDIPLENILVGGVSEADVDMMQGNTLAVAIGQKRHGELGQLEGLDNIYFASQPHALGILEGIEHYDFLGK